MISRPRRYRPTARPILESLEDRLLLYSTTGNLWSYGSRITYSFAPDGTNVGGVSSNLFSSLATQGLSTSQVEVAVEKAAAAWQAVTNINLALVSDSGDAFGISGNQQDDSRFGDIRIGGQALAANILGSTFLPPAANGGTLAGDVVINTNQPWTGANDYDLETVAIHEFGHALGMDHSAIQSADMYAYYGGTKQALTSDDTSGIQSIYGVRKQDSFDSVATNNTLATATNINPYMNAAGQISLGGPNGTGSPVNLDITANTDYDYYAITAPSNTSGTLTVTMQSSNLSSLDPKVMVYNSSNQCIGTATAPASYGAAVSITITGVTAGAKFTVKCGAADTGPSGTGASRAHRQLRHRHHRGRRPAQHGRGPASRQGRRLDQRGDRPARPRRPLRHRRRPHHRQSRQVRPPRHPPPGEARDLDPQGQPTGLASHDRGSLPPRQGPPSLNPRASPLDVGAG